jgi:hypothetical protein
MAATITQIRDAIAAALTDATNGVNANLSSTGFGWNVTAKMVALPQPPAIDIRPGGIAFDTAMARGNDDLTFIIRAVVAFNQDQAAQDQLDTLIDPTRAGGLKAVLEHEKFSGAGHTVTLGGTISDLRVTDVSDYKALLVEGQPPMLAVEFTVEVLP